MLFPIMNLQKTNRHLVSGVIFTTFLATAAGGFAKEDIHFNVIKEDNGQRHISIIPESGYAKDGEILESYDPNSIVYQHARMLEDLRMEHIELTRRSNDDSATAGKTVMPRDNSSPQSSSGNMISDPAPDTGKTDLEKLIELEKRGGRTAPVQGESP